MTPVAPVILLVEDDEDDQLLLEDALARAGHRFATARTGPAALTLAYELHPALIILDVGLPGLDGWETIERLREVSDVPVLFLSGRTSPEDKVRGLRSGADDYLTKPFSEQELLARVARLLPTSPVQDDGVVRIDARRKAVELMGAPVALSPTEFALLSAFAAQPGRVLSREQLAQQVWDDHSGESTEYVRLAVGSLRAKLRESADVVVIETVRGFGFRYAA